MRIAMINEGTYPYVKGGVSTWCDQLVQGLAEHDFGLVTLTATGPERVVWELPDNTRLLPPVPVWGRARLLPRARRRAASEAATLICFGMLDDSQMGRRGFAAGVRELAELAGDGHHPLAGVDLAPVLLEAWRRSDVPLPPLTLHGAEQAAVLLEHSIRPVAAQLSDVDICHAVAGGLPSLVALAAKWRSGVPLLMSEHGVYLRERYLAMGSGFPIGVKAAALRFFRALARLCYSEADLVAPVSDFNRRWEIRHGVEPDKIITVANGVSPERYPPLEGEPDRPTVTWVGRVDPLKDLETLVRAFRLVHGEVNDARLRLFGPVPVGNETYAADCRRLVSALRLDDAVAFEGPVASSREAFAAGHVVALSSISEGMPYTVIEAMMCGKATVSTDVGGVAETVADAGHVVPPRDPEAFAEACHGVLVDGDRRRELGARARARALSSFTLANCVDVYRQLYLDLAVRARTLPATEPVAV
jgi:glycosyltransferase involved in cell wall biosynthesis